MITKGSTALLFSKEERRGPREEYHFSRDRSLSRSRSLSCAFLGRALRCCFVLFCSGQVTASKIMKEGRKKRAEGDGGYSATVPPDAVATSSSYQQVPSFSPLLSLSLLVP